jgi:hypothetical protein
MVVEVHAVPLADAADPAAADRAARDQREVVMPAKRADFTLL